MSARSAQASALEERRERGRSGFLILGAVLGAASWSPVGHHHVEDVEVRVCYPIWVTHSLDDRLRGWQSSGGGDEGGGGKYEAGEEHGR